MKAKALSIVLASFITGVFASYFWEPSLASLLALAGSLFSMALLRRNWRVFVVASVVLAFAFGTFWSQRELWRKSQVPILGSPFVGTVWDVEKSPYYKSQSLLVRPSGENCFVRVRTQNFPEFAVGDRLEVAGKLGLAKEVRDKKDGVCYEGNYPEIKTLPRGRMFFPSSLFVRSRLASLKETLLEKMRLVYPEPYAAMVAGVLLGDKAGLSPELYESFSRCGLTHIMAVSGYNVVILASALGSVASHFSKRISFLAMVSGIWFFVLLVGAPASAVRAGIMATALLVARFAGRDYYPLTSLMLTASLMVFANPLVLGYDLGFQLSFLAAVGVIYYQPVFQRLLRGEGLVFETVAVTLAAQFMVMPLLIYSFGKLSVVSPLANFLVLPFVPPLMLFSFLSVLFAFFWPSLALGFGFVAWFVMEGIFRTVEYFSGFSWASLDWQAGLPHLMALYILVLDINLLSWRYGKEKDVPINPSSA